MCESESVFLVTEREKEIQVETARPGQRGGQTELKVANIIQWMITDLQLLSIQLPSCFND